METRGDHAITMVNFLLESKVFDRHTMMIHSNSLDYRKANSERRLVLVLLTLLQFQYSREGASSIIMDDDAFHRMTRTLA